MWSSQMDQNMYENQTQGNENVKKWKLTCKDIM